MSKATQTAPSGQGPLITSGLYARQQICDLLKITDNTFARWMTLGLRTLRPHTKAYFVLGEELIEFLKTLRDEE